MKLQINNLPSFYCVTFFGWFFILCILVNLTSSLEIQISSSLSFQFLSVLFTHLSDCLYTCCICCNKTTKQKKAVISVSFFVCSLSGTKLIDIKIQICTVESKLRDRSILKNTSLRRRKRRRQNGDDNGRKQSRQDFNITVSCCCDRF